MENKYKKIFNTNKLWMLTIKAKNPWKVLTIVACTHWDEIYWMEIFDYLINEFILEKKIISWTINLLIWNKEAYLKWKKIVDFDFNRIWWFEDKYKWSYEYKRANEIKEILYKSDYLIDLHSTTLKSIPMIIPVGKQDDNLIDCFSWTYVLKNLIEFLNWVALAKYAKLKNPNLKAIVIEAWQNNDPKTIEDWKQNIIKFLWYYWFIQNNTNIIKTKKIYLYAKKCIHAKTMNVKFLYSESPQSFQKIKKWTDILQDWENVVKADKDYIIIMPTTPRYIGEELWYLCESESE